jgi:hypothetical protein
MSELAVPVKVLDQHLVVLGKTGAGKSSTLRHFVEYLLSHNKRVCIIDPKGDWWGLKAAADGKGKGFPVITFGQFKGEEDVSDVPISRESGTEVAEIVASGNRPMVIGLRGWMPAAQSQFWVDFASTIYNSKSCGGLYLIIDEIQNWAPKERTGFEAENMALYWTKKLLSEGRGLGLTIFCGSQRPQSVHNGVLTQCETLVAMRLIHDADCTAVESWLKRTRDKEKRAEIMTSLPDLGRGEAWVWSPEVGFGPVRMQFPMFETFDSFAALQLQKKVNKRGWADVNLEDVRQKLAAVIEEKRANDPRELKAEIVKLNRTKMQQDMVATRATQDMRRTVEKRVEVPVLKDGQIAAVETVLTRAERLFSKYREDSLTLVSGMSTALKPLEDAFCKVRDAGLPSPARETRALPGGRIATGQTIRPNEQSPLLTGTPAATSVPPPPVQTSAKGGTDLPPRRQRILDALLFFESLGYGDAAREWVAFFCDTSPNSSTYEKDCGAMRSAGLVSYPAAGRMQLQEPGRTVARPTQPISLPEFHAKVERLLPPRRQKIARALIDVYPDALRRDQLAERCVTSADSSTFEKDLGGMRTAGLLVYPQPNYAKAADLLFPPLPA